MQKGQEVSEQSLFINGISDYEKYGPQGSYAFGRSVDHRSNPREITLLPATAKESGAVVDGLVKWGVRPAGYDTTYLYDDKGSIYSRSLSGTYSKIRTVPDASGNGLEYYGEDGYVYYPTDKAIGRYGPLFADTQTFSDNFLRSEGGNPTNTASLELNGSTQYADAADSASLSQTGDLTLQIYANADALPAVGNTATLIGKWDESGTTKSYRMALLGVSGSFGDGSDGALTISTNTTDSPIDSACSGTSGTTSLSATNASFSAGQKIFIHQTRGTGAGTYQETEIASYTAGTITTTDNLNYSYNSTGSNKAQVLVLKQYTDVTVDAGVTWSAKAWNGTVGGILAFLANGTLTVNGTISATGKGYLGASASGSYANGRQGEGTAGARNSVSTSANGNGGGGGLRDYDWGAAGGAGGHASGGGNGGTGPGPYFVDGGDGGGSAGNSSLTTMVFGGGGGSGGGWHSGVGGAGGAGGGIILSTVTTLTMGGSGSIVSKGSAGSNPASGGGAGGPGAAGSVLVNCQTATLGSGLVTATATSGTTTGTAAGSSRASSEGRIVVNYYTSYSGTSSPSLVANQDDSLVTNTTHQLRLSVSDDGSTTENLGRTVDISTGQWHHYAVSWDASTSTATFYLDGVSQGTSVGSMTAIDDNTSLLYLGANMGASAMENYFGGKLDEPRIYSSVISGDDIISGKDFEESSSTQDLEAYWELDEATSDSSANSNSLTLRNSPSYSTSVPFSAPTTRLDLDQSLDTSGNTYTLATTISEGATHRQTFTPEKDPQKSIEVLIAAKGTGDWTLTVHDPLNREVASKTVINANLPSSGDYEFVFDSAWTPVVGASYHFHLTSTVADGTVTTTTASDLETIDFHTYYQFLVTDTDYHPALQMLNFVAVGNGRYVAKYAADSGYDPHAITLPPGWKVRSLARWRHYLAIGCWRGDNVYSHDQGIIFFWDGISQTYNDFIDVPEGAINSMHSSQGLLYIVAGYQGDLLEYAGGTAARKIKRLPKVTKSVYSETLPGALSMWQAALRWGASTSDSTSIERGVYTWDNLTEGQPKSLSYDYPISTGTRTSADVQVGMLLPVDGKMLVSWKDGVSYGVDVIDLSGNPYQSGTVESLIQDYGAMWKEKSTVAVGAVFEPLASGESVTIKYKLDRASSWEELTEDTAGETTVKLELDRGRHREVQVAVDLKTTTTTSPTVLGFGNFEDLLISEERFLPK